MSSATAGDNLKAEHAQKRILSSAPRLLASYVSDHLDENVFFHHVVTLSLPLGLLVN